MTATEMHDLLALAFGEIAKAPLYEPGVAKEFRHLRYCRFCHYEQGWIADHGHGEKCLYGRLQQACSDGSASEKQT